MSDDLRKLAEAATPGPWVNSRKGIGPRCVSGGQDDGMILVRVYADFPNDAAFIAAASPDVVLGLLGRVKEQDKTIKDLLAHLVAATSLLERGGRKGAPSDKMFHMMLDDYNRCIERARATLEETP
jgi:hypothetical protein